MIEEKVGWHKKEFSAALQPRDSAAPAGEPVPAEESTAGTARKRSVLRAVFPPATE